MVERYCAHCWYFGQVSELKASLENADICYYSRGFSNLLCYQHHPYTQSETKLDGVQGIMRFGSCPHLSYTFDLSTQPSFADALSSQ